MVWFLICVLNQNICKPHVKRLRLRTIMKAHVPLYTLILPKPIFIYELINFFQFIYWVIWRFLVTWISNYIKDATGIRKHCVQSINICFVKAVFVLMTHLKNTYACQMAPCFSKCKMIIPFIDNSMHFSTRLNLRINSLLSFSFVKMTRALCIIVTIHKTNVPDTNPKIVSSLNQLVINNEAHR